MPYKNKEDSRESARQYYKSNRDKELAKRTLYKQENREKRFAHDKVYEALEQGKLKRGVCEVCGKSKVDAHHKDYTKPLVVNWLCRKHHVDEHMKQC